MPMRLRALPVTLSRLRVQCRSLHFHRPRLIPDSSTVDTSILESKEPSVIRSSSSPSCSFTDTLQSIPDRLVAVEHGTYTSPTLDRLQFPLHTYIAWIRSGESTVDGQQLYLAQESSLWADEPTLQQQHPIPPILKGVLNAGKADLYQAALFLGPPGALSECHYDPTSNLFQILEAPNQAAKAFLVFPPTVREDLGLSQGSSRNTLQLHLQFKVDEQGAAFASEDEGLAARLAEHARACVLREGDMLHLPPRWWHTVKNVATTGDAPAFVAGMGWWFHIRHHRR